MYFKKLLRREILNSAKRKIICISCLSIIVFLISVSIKIFEDKRNEKLLDVFVSEKKLPIHSVNTEEKSIALTFDVNWAEKEYLNDILNIMDKYNVKGTFFVMGKWVNYPKENEDKLKLIYERGHEIGNHSYMHPNFLKISPDRKSVV